FADKDAGETGRPAVEEVRRLDDHMIVLDEVVADLVADHNGTGATGDVQRRPGAKVDIPECGNLNADYSRRKSGIAVPDLHIAAATAVQGDAIQGGDIDT